MARRVKKQETRKPRDLKASLACCSHPALNRKVGVFVGEPYQHRGLGKTMVDAEYEIPTVNSEAFGGPKDLDQVDDAVRYGLRQCLHACREIRDEMDKHARRLVEELRKLGDDPNDD